MLDVKVGKWSEAWDNATSFEIASCVNQNIDTQDHTVILNTLRFFIL